MALGPDLRPPNERWGVSDPRDVTGLNRAYHERLSDRADSVRYHADPPVLFRTVGEHTDLAVNRASTVTGPSGTAIRPR